MSINTKFGEQPLFKCDLEQNVYWNISMIKLWKYVKIVHHRMKIQGSALSHLHLKLETEHFNSQATMVINN
jgi:hypothetical protein